MAPPIGPSPGAYDAIGSPVGFAPAGHWMACSSIEHAAHGLHSDRYGDAQHLATIIFEHMLHEHRGEGWGFGIAARRVDNQFPILVIDATSRWATSADRGSADVWFEDDDGRRTSRVWTREEFLAIADTIPPFLPSRYDPEDEPHDCAFGRFLIDEPRRALPTPSDQDPAA